jgi:hypothetical protein
VSRPRKPRVDPAPAEAAALARLYHDRPDLTTTHLARHFGIARGSVARSWRGKASRYGRAGHGCPRRRWAASSSFIETRRSGPTRSHSSSDATRARSTGSSSRPGVRSRGAEPVITRTIAAATPTAYPRQARNEDPPCQRPGRVPGLAHAEAALRLGRPRSRSQRAMADAILAEEPPTPKPVPRADVEHALRARSAANDWPGFSSATSAPRPGCAWASSCTRPREARGPTCTRCSRRTTRTGGHRPGSRRRWESQLRAARAAELRVR